ncbi:MAG: dihydrolipoamide acetyltransferase family protein [Giesbergeria sp.]|jgi:pyruvate dehydrogenase E2 component (dihydrolipoamide acetyltransferase)|nr:dihydrolipoamide acetyltransferase family protein [Giesbergeria sp.]
MADFLMPALGADMETGKVVQWLVQPGARVRSGDVVAVVETHKGAIDVEIFLDGVIDRLAPLNEPLPVGAVLARVLGEGEAGEAVPPSSPAPAPLPVTRSVPSAPTVPVQLVQAPVAERRRVSPAARRRARQLGLDPSALEGTGLQGAVTLADVEHAGAVRTVTPLVRRAGFDPAQMRQAIAAAMGKSKREIPHYYLSDDLDFSVAHQWMENWNRERPPEQRLLAAALLLKATAQALQAVPQFNGFFENGAFRPGPGIHIGWAISLRGGGLVAPALHDVDRLSLPQVMEQLRDLVQRARSGGLRSSELTDPTITVTSLGDRGAQSVLGVIYPPQVAIVGFGRVGVRPWVVDGAVVARPVLNTSLAADHRVTDGHLGGQLLAAIAQALRQPQTL